jgi:hypothetical protein
MRPKNTPIAKDPNPSPKKLPTIYSGARIVIPFYIAPATVLKSIIATASLTMPSPKIKEKSFGCSSYLTIDIAAITSDEQRSEAITKHSDNFKSIVSHLDITVLLYNNYKDILTQVKLFHSTY